MQSRNPAVVHVLAAHLLAELRPAAPAAVSNSSVLPWLVAAVVLAVIVLGGVYLTSRR